MNYQCKLCKKIKNKEIDFYEFRRICKQCISDRNKSRYYKKMGIPFNPKTSQPYKPKRKRKAQPKKHIPSSLQLKHIFN